MNIDATAQQIRKAYSVITGRSDNDLTMTYKGTGYGVSTPWVARIDARESAAISPEQALLDLLTALKEELNKKISDAEKQAKTYRFTLSSLEN